MAPTKGFFSVIQFCPDLDRGEYANVGVVLVVPGLSFLDVRLSDDNEGPKQRFGKDSFDDARLSLAKKAIAGRLRQEGAGWSQPEDLARFGQKEGNNMLVSPPRTILVVEPAAELSELYQRLVHVDARHRRRTHKPDLKHFAEQLMGVPLQFDLEVEIPEVGTLEVPFAYRNGVTNLVKPEGFPVDPNSATEKANDLAVKGHLLFKHSRTMGDPKKLVVVGGFDESTSDDVKRRISFVLQEHDARLVREDQLDSFVEEVRREAH